MLVVKCRCSTPRVDWTEARPAAFRPAALDRRLVWSREGGIEPRVVVVLTPDPFEALVLRDGGDFDRTADGRHNWPEPREHDRGMDQELRQIDGILDRHGCGDEGDI